MKVSFVSLGCDKNTVDSEMMLGLLHEAGHEIVYDDSEAEAVVINTCAFIMDAQKESVDTILEYGRKKSEGSLRYIIVTGCLGQRFCDDIVRLIPEVDAILGIQSFDKLPEVLTKLERNDSKHTSSSDPVKIIDDISSTPISGKRRLLTTPVHYAYMKLAEGCSKACTYCIIPKLRGPYRSVPKEVLIKEAGELADRGVKELILVAQETTVYGVDLYGRKMLPELLREFAAIEGIEHIRILYCYPEEITDELIDTIKNEPKIYHYIDMPIQHASDHILKKMGRRTNEQGIRAMIGRLREAVPDICIRTTLMTGFPGESRADFKILMRFVEDMRFDRLGVFCFSPEEGTVAAGMKHKVPHFIGNRRRDLIMARQQSIVFEKNESLKGSVFNVVIQGYLAEDNVYVARSYRDAPDVDGLIFLKSERSLISGENIDVIITGARGYDLTAEPVSGDDAASGEER